MANSFSADLLWCGLRSPTIPATRVGQVGQVGQVGHAGFKRATAKLKSPIQKRRGRIADVVRIFVRKL